MRPYLLALWGVGEYTATHRHTTYEQHSAHATWHAAKGEGRDDDADSALH